MRFTTTRLLISKKTREKLKQRTDGHCWYCGDILSSNLCIDHIVPLSRGGADSEENYRASCRQCNAEKGSKLLYQYRLTFMFKNEFWIAAKALHETRKRQLTEHDEAVIEMIKFLLSKIKPYQFWGEYYGK
jgi:5-methylcytosine-specific restriction protein A